MLIVAVLFLLLWSTRSASASRTSRCPISTSFEEALPSIAGLTGSPILPGNRVEVLQNGDGFFPALLDDIAAARETHPPRDLRLVEGRDLRRVAEALAAKARQGVEVRLPLDAVGSNKGDDELFEDDGEGRRPDRLLPPLPPQDLGLFNNRTHRKIAIFDGRVAYVFGHGIAEEWTGHAQDERALARHRACASRARSSAPCRALRRELGGADGRGAGRGEVLPPPRRRRRRAGPHDGQLAPGRRLPAGAALQAGHRLAPRRSC